jgi:hypothetical protein
MYSFISMSDTTLKRNCVINPATDRAVRADGKIGQRVIERRRAQKEAKAKGKPAPKPKVKTETPPPPKPADDFKTAHEIPPAPVPVILDKEDTPFTTEPTSATNKYTLKNRIKFIKKVKELIKDIDDNDCVEPKTFGKEKGYTIRDIINLEKKIGTESAYGVIYKTTIKGAPKSYAIASKLMANSMGNMKEVSLMNDITDNILLTEMSKHFLASYDNAVCLDDKMDGKKRPNKLKLLAINELAHGDLKGLVAQKTILKNDDLVFNLMIQVVFSVATFHNLMRHTHNDCHYGNFLYQKNNEKGWYHYQFKDKNIYLKSCDYNIAIYDYGLAKSKMESKDIMTDYYRPIHAFLAKGDGWSDYYDAPKKATNASIKEIKSQIAKEYVNKPDVTAMEMFQKILDMLTSKTKNTILTLQKPANVINDTPFILG